MGNGNGSIDWEGLLEHVTNEKIIAFFTQPIGLGILAVLMVLSLVNKWRIVFVIVVATGAISFLARSTLASGSEGPDQTILMFAGGAMAIGGFAIYYLFIRED
jgi:predicted membrane channel-forming protein YqfA (hemolysin III family)